MTSAPGPGRPSRSGRSFLTAGTALAFFGFLVIVVGAILIDALANSVGALQVQQMTDAVYVGFTMILVGLGLVFAGLSRRPATPA